MFIKFHFMQNHMFCWHFMMSLSDYKGILRIKKCGKITSSFLCSWLGGGVAQWLGRRISDQGVPGSNPGRCTFRCGLEQVTFTLLSTG